MREELEFCKICGGAHSTGVCQEREEPPKQSDESVKPETPPEEKSEEGGRDAMVDKERGLFEKVRGRAREVAAVLSLVTALSVLSPARTEARSSWYGSRSESRIEMTQKEEEKKKVRVLEHGAGYDKRGNPPEWVQQFELGKRIFEVLEDGKRKIYVAGKAKGWDHSLTRRQAEADAKRGLIKAIREKIKQEKKEELLRKGETKEYVESEEFETGINHWLNEVCKKGIPFGGVMPDESCWRRIIEIKEGEESEPLYEAHARFKMPKKSFDSACEWVRSNLREAMKSEK